MLVDFHEYPNLDQSIGCAIGDIILSCSTKSITQPKRKKNTVQIVHRENIGIALFFI